MLATLGTLGAELEAAQVKPPAIIVVGGVVAVAHPGGVRRDGRVDPVLMATLHEISDPDPASPTTATCVTSSSASTSRRPRAVPRRGREGRTPRGRGRLRTALVPDGPALAGRARGHPGSLGRAVLRGQRGARRGGDRVPRPPRRPRLLQRRPLPDVESVLSRRPNRAGPRGHRGPHEHRSDPPERRALGSMPCCWPPRCADPLYRRSIKVAMGAVFTMPWTRLPDCTTRPPVALREVHDRGTHARRRRDPDRGRGRRARQGRARARLGGARTLVALGAGGPTGARSSRCARGSTR